MNVWVLGPPQRVSTCLNEKTPVRDSSSSKLLNSLKARLGREWSQLELVRPTRFVLSVEIIVRLSDLQRIHHYFRSLLGQRQGAGAWRVDKAVYHDIGYVYAVFGVFLC